MNRLVYPNVQFKYIGTVRLTARIPVVGSFERAASVKAEGLFPLCRALEASWHTVSG